MKQELSLFPYLVPGAVLRHHQVRQLDAAQMSILAPNGPDERSMLAQHLNIWIKTI